MIRSMAKAVLWAGSEVNLKQSELLFFWTQRPKNHRSHYYTSTGANGDFLRILNRYLLLTQNHKYTYFHKLSRALKCYDFYHLHKATLLKEEQRNAIVSIINMFISQSDPPTSHEFNISFKDIKETMKNTTLSRMRTSHKQLYNQ